jgi:2-furoyl-CoA dehydrogenase large subunit
MSEPTHIGKRTRSKEGPRQVSGHGQFTDDFSFPGMLHAAILRSCYAHAWIRRIDTQAALDLPGVIAILTPEEVMERTRPFKPGRYAAGLKTPVSEYASAVHKVRYVGEPVAVVAARSRCVAEDALDLIYVEYEPLPAVVDPLEAMRPSAPLLFEELESNVAWQGEVRYGDVDQAFRSADEIVREKLKTHRYSSTPLEPLACVASFDDASQKLTVWCNGQNPDVIYDGLGEALDLKDIRVIIPDVGGGFGQKIHLIRKYVVLTSLMSLKTGRPVKWIEDRTEHMMAAGQSCGQQFDVEAAVKRDGTVLGLKIKELDDVGGAVSTLTIHFTNKLNNLFSTYGVKSLRLQGRAVVTNKCPVVPNRGIGKPSMCFIWERMMDRIAQELGMSRVQVRSINLIPPDEFPYIAPNGNVYDSGDYPALIQRALENVEYEKVRQEQQRAREEGRFLGIGLVIGLEPGGRNAARDAAIFPNVKEMPGAGGIEGATVKLEKNGTATVLLGSPSCGQFHETTASQVVAEVLGILPAHISVVSSFDSETSPWGVCSSNSGNNFHLYDIGAVHGAALKLREKVLNLASRVLKNSPDDLIIREGTVYSHQPSEEKVSFARLSRIAYGDQSYLPETEEAGMQSTYYYKFPHAEPFMVPDEKGRVRAQFTFSAAVHAAVVEIDRETGRVQVLRYIIVSDNGTIINPDVVDGQIYGSVAHGISVALGEEFVYDSQGQLLTVTLTDYSKSSILETPKVEIEHYPVPSPFSVLGQKAAGEGAAIPSPAAIASAVENALQPFDVRVRELPLSSEVIWRLLHQGRTEFTA